MQRNWDYEENPFLNATEHSYELMFKINEFHYNALLANSAIPFMAERAAFYAPFHSDYEAKYTAWENSGGTQKSETLTVDQLLALKVQKLNGWEPLITTHFAKGSPGYMKLFPRAKYPFNSGSKDQQIAAFATLAKALGRHAAAGCGAGRSASLLAATARCARHAAAKQNKHRHRQQQYTGKSACGCLRCHV